MVVVLISSAAGLVGIGSGDPGSAATRPPSWRRRHDEGVRNHLAPQNIRVNSVHPCGVDTPMSQQ